MTSECKAKNPAFCRYHGEKGETNTVNARKVFFHTDNELKKLEAEATPDLEMLYNTKEWRDSALQAYAATDEGHEYVTGLAEEAPDDERERYETILAQGARERERHEEKADGVIVIPTSRLEEAEKRLARANRKLERSGIDGQFTYDAENFYEEDRETGFAVAMTRLTLNHPEYRVGEHTFMASVEEDGNGNLIVNSLPGQDIGDNRPTEQVCEHCGKNRKRSKTYMLKDSEGNYHQIGKSCLKAYTGVNSMNMLWALQYEPEEGGDKLIDRGERNPNDWLVPTREVVAAAIVYSEKGASYRNSNHEAPTVNAVRNAFFGKKKDKFDGYQPGDQTLLADADSLMKETSFDGDSDYEHNMRTLLKNEWTSRRHMGYVTSVVGAWARQNRKKKEAAEKPKGFIAPVDEKLRDQRYTIKSVRHIENTYDYYGGEKTILVFTDQSGKEAVWFASKRLDYGQEDEGKPIELSYARVKKHREYNGADQTVLSNCKIVENND